MGGLFGMNNSETLQFRTKDFFGEYIDGGWIQFWQDDDLIHETPFEGGRVEVMVPDNIPPGLYDVVSKRDDGDEYRIRDMFIPLSAHFYRHAQLHDDIQLKNGNFSGLPIESGKFNPELYQYINQIGTLKEDLDKIAQYHTFPDSLRWGGMIYLGQEITVKKGEAVIGGEIISWEDTVLPFPTPGIYSIGIKNGTITVDTVVDYPFANLYKDATDWSRLEVITGYHGVQRGNDLFYFEGYESIIDDVDMVLDTNEILEGQHHEGKVFGRASSRPKDRAGFNFIGSGPVLEWEKLYLYATTDYFLLWEGDVLLTALPRFSTSGVYLDLRDGISFCSYGEDGHVRWSNYVPRDPSSIHFRQGDEVKEIVEDLDRDSVGTYPLGENRDEWQRIEGNSSVIVWKENYYSRVMLDSPMIYWKLDDEVNFTYDRKGNFDGQIYGDITTGDINTPLGDELKYSYNFDGDTGFIQFSVPSMDSPDEFTLECWVYPSEIREQGIVVRGDYGWQMRMDIEGRIVYENYPDLDGYVATQPITINTWHHIVALYDSSTSEMKMYRNGVLEDSTVTYSGNAQRNLITYNQSSFEDGVFSDVRIFGATGTVSTEDVHEGNYSAKLVSGAGHTQLDTYSYRPFIPANINSSSQISFKAPAGENIEIATMFYRTSDSVNVQNYSDVIIASGEWQTVKRTFPAESMDRNVALRFLHRDSIGGEVFYIDALQIEYAWETKNLLSYNQSSAEEGTTAGMVAGNSNIQSQSTEVYSGDYSFGVTASSSAPSDITINVNNKEYSNGFFTVKAMMKQIDLREMQVFARIKDIDTTANVRFPAVTAIATGGWDEFVLSLSLAVNEYIGDLIFRNRFPVAGDVHYVDNLQLEKNSVATEWEKGYGHTPWQPGIGGPGSTVELSPSSSKGNLLTYNQSSIENGDATGFNPASASISSSTEDVLEGVYSLRCESTIDGAFGFNTYGYRPEIAANASVSIKYSFKGIAGKQQRLRITFRRTDGTTLHDLWIDEVTDGTWQRMELVTTSPNEVSLAHLTCQVLGGVIGELMYADKLQLEEYGFPTEWKPGIGDAGYPEGVEISRPRKNLLTYNQSSIEVNTSGIVQQGGASISRTTLESKFGTASLKVDVASGTNYLGMRTQPIGGSVSANKYAKVSAYVLVPSGVAFDMISRGYSVSSGLQLHSSNYHFFVGSGVWERVEVAVYTTNEDFIPNVEIRLRHYTGAQTFYVDGMQVEEGSVATDWEAGGTPYIARWKGNMDEVAYYEKTLTDAQINYHITG